MNKLRMRENEGLLLKSFSYVSKLELMCVGEILLLLFQPVIEEMKIQDSSKIFSSSSFFIVLFSKVLFFLSFAMYYAVLLTLIPTYYTIKFAL